MQKISGYRGKKGGKDLVKKCKLRVHITYKMWEK